MLSPAMYRAIAKRTGIIWPHPKRPLPTALFERFNPGGELSPNTPARCLLGVERSSNYTDSDLAGFKASEKPEIQFYQWINPDFAKGMALFVIIPVHFRQLCLTVLKQLGIYKS